MFVRSREKFPLLRNPRGFTLLELGISITIAAIILVGVSFFVSKVNSEIASSRNRTQIHIEVTNFLEKMNSVRTNFSSGSIILPVSPGYSTLLFTNTGVTSGVLVGVVNADGKNGSGNTLLDASGAYSTYGNKVLWVQELTKTQLQSILSSSANAYAIPFRADKIYPALNVRDFTAVSYNSGAIFDVDMAVYEQYYDEQKWKSVISVDTPDFLSFHLIF